jgi:hypothetical protein
MSLEKAIKHKKEKRKPYYGAKAFDPSCRNHGSCSWCEDNRKYSDKKRKRASEEQIDDYESYDER